MSYDRLSSVTLHQLRIFAAVAGRRSFARGADDISLSQPTVSDQIRLLETQVGARLLDRSPGRKRVELTEAGRVLIRTYDEFSRALDRASRDLDALRSVEGGAVAFGADLTYGAYVFPRVFAAFRRSHPSITVHFELDRRQHLLENVARRRLDLAVLWSPIPDVEFLSESLGWCEVVLVGPPGHRLAGVSPAPFREWAREALILPDRSTAVRQLVERMAIERSVAFNTMVEVSDVDARKQAIGGGLGIGPMSAYSVAEGIASRRFSLLNVEGFPVRLEWFIVQAQRELSPQVLAFKVHLLQHRPAAGELALPRGER